MRRVWGNRRVRYAIEARNKGSITPSPMATALKFLLLTAVVVVVALFAMPATVRTARQFTCLKCRAERWDRSRWGHPHSTTNDSEFTPWYRAHFPAHEHVWSGGSFAGYNILGRQTSCGYVPRHPVAMLPPSMQKEFAESTSATNLEVFYRWTLSDDRELQQKAVEMAFQAFEPSPASRPPLTNPSPR